MPLARTAPLRRELACGVPERPFTVEFWDGTRVTDRGGGPDVHGSLAAGGRPRRCARRASSGSAAPTSPASSRSTTSTRSWRCSTTGSRRRSTRARRCGCCSPRSRAGGLTLPPAAAAAELRPRGRATRRPATPAPSAITTTLHRVLRAVPRPVDDLQLRDLLARRRVARGGPGGEARAGLPQARRWSRASGCSTSAAAGAASRSMPPLATASRSSGSPSRSRRPGGPRARRARPASATGSRSGCMDYRDLAGERSTRSPASAWSSTSAPSGSTSTPPARRRCCGPGGRLLNHGIARLRHSRPRGRAVLGALRLPRRRPAAPVRVLARARAGRLRDRARRGLRAPTTPRRCATGRSARRQPRRGDRARRRRSGCASGGSICGRPATASRAASPRSTRSGRGSPEPTPVRYLGRLLRIRQPSSVTTTRSSILIPNSPGT